MKKEKKFEIPEIEIIVLDNSDIITDSENDAGEVEDETLFG